MRSEESNFTTESFGWSSTVQNCYPGRSIREYVVAGCHLDIYYKNIMMSLCEPP